jgi:hypothetical protein
MVNKSTYCIARPYILKLSKVQGVQTAKNISINKQIRSIINGYSQYAYDIEGATQNGNIYPSLRSFYI